MPLMSWSDLSSSNNSSRRGSCWSNGTSSVAGDYLSVNSSRKGSCISQNDFLALTAALSRLRSGSDAGLCPSCLQGARLSTSPVPGDMSGRLSPNVEQGSYFSPSWNRFLIKAT